MLANKFIVNPETTASILEADPRTDIQGITWTRGNRSTDLRQTVRMLCDFETISPFVTNKLEIQPTLNILKFNSFFENPSVVNSHYQIHNGVFALSETDVLFTSKAGVSCMSFATGQITPVLSNLRVESIRANHQLQLLSGVIDSSVCFLYDLNKKAMVMQQELMNSICNKSIFAIEESPKLLVATNSKILIEYDIEKGKINRPIPTTHAANELDLSDDLRLVALALDAPEITLIDRRSATAALTLLGHKQKNFAIKFLFNFSLASGGEDNTTRFWDLRNPARALYTLESEAAAVRAFEFDRQRKLLYIGESAGYLSICQLNGKSARDVVSYFGSNAGIALSPSGCNFYIGMAKIKPGLARFCLKYPNG